MKNVASQGTICFTNAKTLKEPASTSPFLCIPKLLRWWKPILGNYAMGPFSATLLWRPWKASFCVISENSSNFKKKRLIWPVMECSWGFPKEQEQVPAWLLCATPRRRFIYPMVNIIVSESPIFSPHGAHVADLLCHEGQVCDSDYFAHWFDCQSQQLDPTMFRRLSDQKHFVAESFLEEKKHSSW